MDFRDFDVSMVRPVGALELDALFTLVLGDAFSRHGFDGVSSRKWVRSKKCDIREVLLVQAMKGGSYSIAWGFSLDYVPHVSGGEVAWHRTPRSARLDLRYDPIDYMSVGDDVNHWVVQSLFGEERAESDARELAARVLPLASNFFDSVARIEDLPRVFKAQMLKPAVRFGFHNYIQQPLAYLFTLAKLGHQDEARALLEEYVRDYEVSASAAARLRAFTDAA